MRINRNSPKEHGFRASHGGSQMGVFSLCVCLAELLCHKQLLLQYISSQKTCY